jgi:hypothetical protein
VSARYRELVRWAYEGEVFGAALLRAVLAAPAHAEHRPQVRALLDLEAGTLGLIAPVAARELGPVDDGPALAKAAAYAARVAKSTWPWFLDELADGADRAQPRFDELTALGPAADRALFERLAEHERVMGEFARLARTGAGAEAMTVVRRHLAGTDLP